MRISTGIKIRKGARREKRERRRRRPSHPREGRIMIGS